MGGVTVGRQRIVVLCMAKKVQVCDWHPIRCTHMLGMHLQAEVSMILVNQYLKSAEMNA
jgi:hypothetical protein